MDSSHGVFAAAETHLTVGEDDRAVAARTDDHGMVV